MVFACHSSDDALVGLGWVVSGDEIAFAEKADLVTYVEIDVATNRGGDVSLTVEGRGEVLEMECTPVHLAAVNHHHGVCCIDRMCTFVLGTSKVLQVLRRRRICRWVGGGRGISRRRLWGIGFMFMVRMGR